MLKLNLLRAPFSQRQRFAVRMPPTRLETASPSIQSALKQPSAPLSTGHRTSIGADRWARDNSPCRAYSRLIRSNPNHSKNDGIAGISEIQRRFPDAAAGTIGAVDDSNHRAELIADDVSAMAKLAAEDHSLPQVTLTHIAFFMSPPLAPEQGPEPVLTSEGKNIIFTVSSNRLTRSAVVTN